MTTTSSTTITDVPSRIERDTDTVNNISVEVEPSTEDIQRKPWKFVGYKKYADFIASDDDFHIFRRFNVLNARISLFLQDEIAALEEELAELDRIHSRKSAQDLHNGTFRNDMVENRVSLLTEISEKIYHYNKFMLQQSALGKYPSAPKRDIRSLRNWHHNQDFVAIASEEQKYLNEDDLICILQKDKTPLRRMIDRSYRLRTLNIWRRPDENVPEDDAPDVSYYSDKRIDRFASAVIIAIGMSLLIIPLWILQALSSQTKRLGVITAFILTFLLILSFAMASKPFEALAATAAYAAILMVFMQIGSD